MGLPLPIRAAGFGIIVPGAGGFTSGWGTAGGQYDPFAGVTGGATGIRSSRQRIELVNGKVYELPPGVGFPPNGWYIMSPRAQEEWAISVGGFQVGSVPLSSEERRQIEATNNAPTEQQFSGWVDEQTRLNQRTNMNPAEATLEELKRVARGGGAAAQAALEELAKHGDFFANLALTFGIGYGAVTVALAATAVGIAVVMLKK